MYIFRIEDPWGEPGSPYYTLALDNEDDVGRLEQATKEAGLTPVIRRADTLSSAMRFLDMFQGNE